MESSRESRPTALPNEQKPMGAPVVNAPGLPSMENVDEVRTVLRNTALPLMATDPTLEIRGDNLMAKAEDMSQTPPSHNLGAQRTKDVQDVSTLADGYLRLEVRFDNGQLSIIGVKDVPGPLVNPTAVIQGYVYEVVLADQQITVGSLPDVGVRRAFANRDVPDPEGKHRFVQVPTFDFFVRIPRRYVTVENLPKMEIVLHNVRATPDRLAPAIAMNKQPGVESMEVARLSGIRLESMPTIVRSQLEEIINQH